MTPTISVAYYCATLAVPRRLVSRLCSFANSASVDDETYPQMATLLWPSGDATVRVELFFIRSRLGGGAFFKRLSDLVASDSARGVSPDHGWTRTLRALQCAQAIVFVVDDQREHLGSYLACRKLLRKDLKDAGRDPADIPIVLQIDRVAGDDVDSTPSAELARRLTWPKCAHVEGPTGEDVAKRALDRAIELQIETAPKQQPD